MLFGNQYLHHARVIKNFSAFPMISSHAFVVIVLLCLFKNVNGGELQSDFFQEKEEVQLLDAITAFYSQNFERAMAGVEQLIEKRPNFKSAQLVYAEMLSSLGQKTAMIEESLSLPLSSLKHEIAQRFSADDIDTEGKLPSAVIALADRHAYMLVVDQSRSRLYLIDNTAEVPRVIGDHYITIGKAGIGKTRQNDNKTPVGIYHITKFLTDESLPEIYGTGAYPINYPNAWDRLQKKTGYGIWLHGVPRSTYSRPPRDSRGCITISNDSLNRLKPFLHIGSTPVILADKLEWLPINDWLSRQVAIKSILSRWESDWESLSQEAYFDHYSQGYTNRNGDFTAWKKYKSNIAASKTYIDVRISALDIYQYPGEADLLVTNFQQDYSSNNYPKTGKDRSFKQLYWRLEQDGQWRIIHEAVTSTH